MNFILVKRTEQHIITRNSKHYKMLMKKCHQAKNIYNHGNYLIRQKFIKEDIWLRYIELEQLVKNDLEYPDYWDWDLANSSQQVLRQLDKNWKSFFSAIKDWKKHPDKYTGRPKIPKYLKKDGVIEFALTTNQVKLKNNYIHFPKSMKGLLIKPQFIKLKNFIKFNACRIVPKNERIIIEFIYTIEVPDIKIQSPYIGSIDLGVDNFATFVDNIGSRPIIINGKGLKSYNKYYNKLIASEKSKLDKANTGNYYSHKLYRITNNRNDKIHLFMHRASSYIINRCIDLNIGIIVIGKNKGWKQEVELGKVNNQTFVQIPYQKFINDLKYKGQEVGIRVIETEESYTSGTSFLDGELPTKKNYNIERRIERGLFRSNEGILINSDVNSAYQIMKKVFRDAEMPAGRGYVMNPIRVNVLTKNESFCKQRVKKVNKS